MIRWTKPTGQEIETNETVASISAAKKLGWKLKEAEVQIDARGLPWDERINTNNRSQDDSGNWKYKRGVSSETAAPIEQELLSKEA